VIVALPTQQEQDQKNYNPKAEAAAAIRANRNPDTGLLAQSARQALAAPDHREGHATELRLLVRALGRLVVIRARFGSARRPGPSLPRAVGSGPGSPLVALFCALRPRRRRFRLAFVLHFFGLRRLASLVSGIDP